MGHYSRWMNHTSDRLSGFDRLRVDPAQTSFFEGREFRTFLELNIAQGTSVVVRATVPVPTILWGLDVSLTAGSLRLETRVAGTPGGAFSSTLPMFGRNNLPAGPDHRFDYPGGIYERQVVLESGGTHTGGTVLDLVLLKSSDNSNFGGSVGASSGDERGIAVGTYYFVLENVGADTITGVLHARWEERP